MTLGKKVSSSDIILRSVGRPETYPRVYDEIGVFEKSPRYDNVSPGISFETTVRLSLSLLPDGRMEIRKNFGNYAVTDLDECPGGATGRKQRGNRVFARQKTTKKKTSVKSTTPPSAVWRGRGCLE